MIILTLEESKSKSGLALSVDTLTNSKKENKSFLRSSQPSTGTDVPNTTDGAPVVSAPQSGKLSTTPIEQPAPAPLPSTKSSQSQGEEGSAPPSPPTGQSSSSGQSLASRNSKFSFRKEKDVADKVDDNIDGIGSNTKNSTNGSKPSNTPLIITASPFKVKECNQILMFDAEYIEDLRDYRKRKPAFFTINVLSVHMFKTRDANNLIHSVNFPTIKRDVEPLKGAKGCLSVEGGDSSADLTICFKSDADSENLLNAIKNFKKCRQGENLVEVSEETLKALNKQCEGEKKPSNPDEINLEVRPGNKWDADRARHFQPSQIKVPGTNPPEPPKH